MLTEDERGRRYTLAIVVELVGALIPIASMMVMARTPTIAVSFQQVAYLLPPQLLNITVALFLWRSPSISAYLDRENAVLAMTL